jgi:hypothetical protein
MICLKTPAYWLLFIHRLAKSTILVISSISLSTEAKASGASAPDTVVTAGAEMLPGSKPSAICSLKIFCHL